MFILKIFHCRGFWCVFFFLFFFFPQDQAFAGVQYSVTGCPVSSSVSVAFQWKSTVNTTIASNTTSVLLPETPSGVFSSFILPALSSASGSVLLDMSSGTLQSFTCTAASDTGTVFNETFLLGFAGIVCGSLIAYTFAKAGSWGGGEGD